MVQPKISVIIPVYNTEDYIEETLMSLLNQTMIDDIEVLMIDDGSSDDSRYIIEKYALDYDNFHAYHKENEGQGVARNYALEFASGEYIHFLDSDDYLPPEAYERMYEFALGNKNDIVICNVSHFSFYNNWEDILFKNSYNKLSGNIDSITLNDYLDMLWDTITCNKLYNKNFLERNNIRFLDKKIFFEDIPFSLESYILADSIAIVKDDLYYWRFRNNKTSTTQQELEVRNFKNRLEILRLCSDLLDKYEVSQEIRNFLHVKWLNHDLKFFLKRINQYPDQYYNEILDEVYEIIKVIPSNLFDDLTSYQKVLFSSILNKDYDTAISFAPLENELYKNPQIPSFLDEKYIQYFDFEHDIESQDLNVEAVDISHDESNLFLEFKGLIYFMPSQCEYGVSAELIGEDEQFNLEVEESKIIIPIDLVKNRSNLKIKITYDFDNFTKENYLKIKKRRLISFDDFDIEINFRKSFHLYIDFKNKKENKIVVSDISFDSNEFMFKAKSQDKVKQMVLENNITFEKFYYDVEYTDKNIFRFIIPYSDILSSVIKKWELNCVDSLNNVSVDHKFHFFTKNYEIKFSSIGNKIYVSNQIYNPINALNDLKNKNETLISDKKKIKKDYSNLNKKYSKLKDENSSLKESIDKFKSRKVVKFADKFKL